MVFTLFSRRRTLLIAVMVGLLLSVGLSFYARGQANEPQSTTEPSENFIENALPQNGAVLTGQPAAAIEPRLYYQARLLNPTTGAPQNGTLTMTFRLYDVASGGSDLWTELRDVEVTGGLLSVDLGSVTPLNLAIFDGRQLWLGIKVGADPEATPRQRIGYNAYALYADNAARLGGQDPSAFAPTSHNHGGGQITTGIVADARIAGTLTRDGEVFGIVTDNDGVGSGLDADLLDGINSDGFSRSTHNHDGAYLNTTGPDGMGGNSTRAILSIGQDGAGDGLLAVTASTDPGEGGVHGRAGEAGPSMNSAAGVVGDSSAQRGVVGTSVLSEGVLGYSDKGTGVAGESTDGYGVYAFSVNKEAIYAVGNIAATGDVTADKVVYNSPRVHSYSIAGDMFVPRDIDSGLSYNSSSGNGGAYISGGTQYYLHAGVNLPDGANVTNFQVYFYDTAAVDLTAAFSSLGFTGGYASFGSVTSAGISGYGNRSTAVSHTISNASRGYKVSVYRSGGGWSTYGASLKIMGAVLTYTLDEAP